LNNINLEKNIIKKLHSNYNKNFLKSAMKKTEKKKMVSKGQQTIMKANNIDILKNNDFISDYNDYNNRNDNNNINNDMKKYQIKNKLTKNNFKSKDIINIRIKGINNNYINNIHNEISGYNHKESNNSSLVNNISNLSPKNKQNNYNYTSEKKIKINNYIQNEINSFNKENYKSKNINEVNYILPNNYNYNYNYKNKTYRINRNNSNIVSLDDVLIDDRSKITSLREFYRQMISNKKSINKKKYNNKSILKNSKIREYLNKNAKKKAFDKKKFNSNLISLEQYTLDKKRNKKNFSAKIKINNCNSNYAINNNIISYYLYNLDTNGMKHKKIDLNENIFSSILRSLSSENYRKNNNNEQYNKTTHKSSHINILTMIKLNNRIKNNI
jgi:hypothetical protein